MAFVPGTWAQIAVILLGACAGLVLCRGFDSGGNVVVAAAPIPRSLGIAFAAAPCILLALSFLLAREVAAAPAAAFYRSGALVFGGGHVVLPLLRAAL
jgi:chromate transporter